MVETSKGPVETHTLLTSNFEIMENGWKFQALRDCTDALRSQTQADLPAAC